MTSLTHIAFPLPSAVLDPHLVLSCQRNAFDLDLDALWQLLDRDAAPSRLRDKMLLVFCVHFREVGHVRQKGVDLDDSLDARPRSC